jgi:hypothetical protein
VKLAWEYLGHGPGMPAGVLFPNSSTGYTGQGATWQDSGLNGVLIKEAVNGPVGSSHPAWRVRVRYPLQTALDGRPFGRWFVHGIHDLQVPSIKTNIVVCGPLPVTLLGQSVQCVEGDAVVEWSTATEQDCDRFQVMRSRDAQTWELATVVQGHGNSTNVIAYRTMDPAPIREGVSYYRIDQYDINGEWTSFPVMAFHPCGNGGTLLAWPNPAKDELFIELPVPIRKDERASAIVRDAAGRVVANRSVEAMGGSRVRISGLQELPPGAYLVELHSADRGQLGTARLMRL